MNKFAAVTIAALMLMAVFVSAASAATSVNTVEVRSPVFSGARLSEITVDFDYTEFAGFYYDIDDDIGSETMRIALVDDPRTIRDNGLIYTSTIQEVGYTYDNWAGEYPKMGFLAQEYVPVNGQPDVLSKLLLDSDDKYTLRVGQTLDLGEGYAVTPKQIDVDGNKVWLELTKDGAYLDDQVLTVTNTDVENSTWEYEEDDVGGEDDVVIMRVHVNEVFQGQVDSLAVVEGMWLISNEPMVIESDDTFGELEVTTIGDNYIELKNDGSIALTKNKEIALAGDVKIQVADSDDVRFYFFKEVTEPGTYPVRGSVATGSFDWDASSFAGFYYDIDANVASEEMNVIVSEGRNIADGALVYTSTMQSVDYEFSDWAGQYSKMGFLAEEYVPVNGQPDVLSKLLLDNDDKYTLRVGQTLDLGEGYALTPKQIDVDGNKVWLELTKDGAYLDDQVLTVTDTDVENSTWDYEEDDVGGEDDVVIMRAHVQEVFQGQVDSLAVVEGMWLISNEPMVIESDDTFGELEVTTIGDNYIELKNDGSMTLSKNKDIALAGNMFFKVADADALRYYPYAEYTIGGNGTTVPGNETPGNETPGNETPAVPGNETPTTPGTPTVVETPTTPVAPGNETPVNETPVEEPAGTPGFEAIFAVAGLLAVAYLVRRN
ncbi:S-layer-related duplication domain protein [Methanomethylovorans hollandica DSM 15978]|uniref:S-layer-related duplication domain protein n=1 Tax=Methanomethylovorans hollandica (strain DSM 15978 / NBRC 107637 / DMS1) TaxID=867904 RepID=L0KTP6_METHD|nr:S-layer protein domain-containing protein [Methanomethylovorans hollandica]AGB48501.1 S-layer-related duplication domain protein [Methanomethylovorans hollandica DSM 15978]